MASGHIHTVFGNRQSIYPTACQKKQQLRRFFSGFTKRFCRSFLRPYRCGLCCTDGLHTWGWRAPNDIDPANQRGALGSFPLGIHGFPMVFLWMGTWSFSSWFSMWDLPWNAHAFGINLGYFQWLLSPDSVDLRLFSAVSPFPRKMVLSSGGSYKSSN